MTSAAQTAAFRKRRVWHTVTEDCSSINYSTTVRTQFLAESDRSQEDT